MATSSRPFAVLLAGGGTGGHVFPALAIARELVSRGCTVTLTGSPRGLEQHLAEAHGVPFVALASKPFVGKGPLAQLAALFTLGRSAWAARALVRRLDARVVVGTGGYASAPALVGARWAERPTLLLEVNTQAGAANRWLSKRADEAFLAVAETARELACPSQVSGIPVRAEFFRVPALTLRKEPPRLLILGGSQGAQQINRWVPAALALVAEKVHGLSVLHQCGRAHVAAAQQAYVDAGIRGSIVKVTPFIDDMAAALAEADLVVSRSGAMTVAEIAAAGRPAVFVPLALAGGHQVENARRLVGAGGADLVAPEEAGAEDGPKRLAGLLTELLTDRKLLVEMGAKARHFAQPEAARLIVDRVFYWAENGRRKKGGAR